MQTDRKRNLCDYTLNSSDSESDSTSCHDDKVESKDVVKTQDDRNEKSNDSTDIRDQLLESIQVDVQVSVKNKNTDSKRERRKRSRSRSRSRERHRNDDHRKRKDHYQEKYSSRGDSRHKHQSERSKRYDDGRDFRRRGDYGHRKDDHRGGFRGRNRSPSRNFGEKDNPPRDFAKTAGKGFDQVLARQKQQLEKRKLLWQGNKEKKVANHWEAMLTTCTDDKQAAKLKKLIGLRDGEGNSSSSTMAAIEEVQQSSEGTSVGSAEQTRLKQEELFRTLDQQYEVARVSTHTHRGVGLGFTTQMNEYWAHIQAAEVAKHPPR